MRPFQVLFQGQHAPIALSACGHDAEAEHLMRKSPTLQQGPRTVFDLALDCEGRAAAGNEEPRAGMAGTIVAGGENYFNRVGVRVHDIRHPRVAPDGAILRCLAAGRLAFVTAPKGDCRRDVKRALAVVKRHARRTGRVRLPRQVLVETPGALADVVAVAASPEVVTLPRKITNIVSSHDGAIPVSAMHSPAQFSHPLLACAKFEIAAACHAHWKIASDNVTTEITDRAVVANDATRTRAAAGFGYPKMGSIHPNQIKPILKFFAPRSSELCEAATIPVAAHEHGWEPIHHNGKVDDRASNRPCCSVRTPSLPLPETVAALV